MAGFSTLGVDVYNFPQTRRNSTYQLADELTANLGSHRMVFGFDGRRTGLDSDLPRLSRPLITFNGTPRLISENGNLRFPTANDPNPIIRPEDLAGMGAASNFLFTFNVDRPDAKANLLYYQINFYGQDAWRVNSQLSLSYGLRYEFNTPVRETNRLIEQAFSDSRLLLPSVSGLNSFIGGRTRLYEPDFNNLAPRVGVAYSSEKFGKDHVSVLRAGYGLFYDQILGAVANQSRNVFPTYLTVNFGGLDRSNPFLAYNNPADATFGGIRLRTPGTINTFNPAINFATYLQRLNTDFPNAITATLPSQRLEMPMAQHFTLSLEQQLSSSFLISAAYIRTLGRHLLRFTTPNLGQSLTISPTELSSDLDPVLPFPRIRGVVRIPVRPVANVGAVNQFETTASSSYNSLQITFRGRFPKKNLNFQAAYTLSKADDDVSDVFDLAGASVLPQDSMNLRAERGAANFDRRHMLVYSVIFNLPVVEKKGSMFRFLTKNLQLSSTGQILSGQPFTVNSIVDVNLDGNLTDRLNTTTGIESTGKGETPLRLTTTNTLALLAPFGQDGAIGRNSFRADRLANVNLGVTRNFVFGPRTLRFRTDFFNLLNRTNFGVPVRFLEAPAFGKATGTVTPGRRIQFSLKYEF
jgi:hypothetical protein